MSCSRVRSCPIIKEKLENCTFPIFSFNVCGMNSLFKWLHEPFHFRTSLEPQRWTRPVFCSQLFHKLIKFLSRKGRSIVTLNELWQSMRGKNSFQLWYCNFRWGWAHDFYFWESTIGIDYNEEVFTPRKWSAEVNVCSVPNFRRQICHF